MKKKKRVPSNRRRHPYERCLQHALARLTKAVREKHECNEKLAALEKEIPYLEQIVHALTPPHEQTEPSTEMPLASIRSSDFGLTPDRALDPKSNNGCDGLKRTF